MLLKVGVQYKFKESKAYPPATSKQSNTTKQPQLTHNHVLRGLCSSGMIGSSGLAGTRPAYAGSRGGGAGGGT